MNALRSLYSKNVTNKFFSPLKSFRGRESVACAGYATEAPATTSTSEDPEALEVPEGPVKVILPGRKHVYEPGYLDKLKPPIPLHNQVDILMKGYDFAVLEQLQKLLCKLLTSSTINVADGWAVRAESWRVQRFEPNSSTPKAEFNLKEYQRVLQLADVPSTKISLVIEVIQAVIPPGVTCSVVPHTEEIEKMKYIPDMGIKALQEQLDELGGPSKLTLQRQREAAYRNI